MGTFREVTAISSIPSAAVFPLSRTPNMRMQCDPPTQAFFGTLWPLSSFLAWE